MKAGKFVIAAVSAGWVFAGTVGEVTEYHVTLLDACVIRRWGTTRGLGELAISGPQAGTVLDPAGTVWISRQHLLFGLACAKRWPL